MPKTLPTSKTTKLKNKENPQPDLEKAHGAVKTEPTMQQLIPIRIVCKLSILSDDFSLRFSIYNYSNLGFITN
jgi:hypothetical protein